MRSRKRAFSKYLVVILTLLWSAALVSGPIWASAAPDAQTAVSSSLSKAQAAESYGRLPLFFTENQGQTDSQVKFYARGQGHAIFFTPEGMVLSLHRGEAKRSGKSGKGKKSKDGALVQLRPQGIRSGVEILATEPLEGKVNCYQGNDPGKWRTEVPTYKSVLYREAYRGIDLKFYGAGQQVEYDLVIKPGADPKQVKFLYQGVQALKVTKEGDLNVILPSGDKLVQKRPVIYQEIDGQRVSREGKFRILPGTGNRGYGFQLASYDTRYPLIIDPLTLVYSTYLGGNTWESGNGIAVDSTGNAYVVGTTQSTDFPTAGTPFQASFGGAPEDAFITKFSPVGGMLYSTYLGGNNDDIGLAIALDSTNAIYVTGETFSSDFPTSPGAFQAALTGVNCAFVTKLDAVGTLSYSTCLGGSDSGTGAGSGSDLGTGIAVDSGGNAYVAGNTSSINFPTAGTPFQALLKGSVNAFVTKVNPTGTAPLLYSTYLGGTTSETAWGLTVDAAGIAYIAGDTQSSDFPTAGTPFQAVNNGLSNAFYSKLNPAIGGVPGLLYSTYLGGAGIDSATGGVAVDTAGNAYLAGNTSSLDFPTFASPLGAVTTFPFQATLNGFNNAFVSKFNANGTLSYSTFLGGSGTDIAWFVALDKAGNAYVTGQTDSADFPTKFPLQPTLTGAPNAFMTEVNATGTGVRFSTYLGGTGQDFGFGVATNLLLQDGIVYLAGNTLSTNFPTKNAFQSSPALTSVGSAFVTRISATPNNVADFVMLLTD